MKIIAGFFIAILINIILFIIVIFIIFSGTAIVSGAIIQLVIIALICFINWNNHRQLAQGLIIGASIVFMGSSLCWGI